MIAWLNKKLKKTDIWDIGLIKWASMAFALFVITIWPAAMDWVHSVDAWWFLMAAVIIGARPFYRFYIK